MCIKICLKYLSRCNIHVIQFTVITKFNPKLTIHYVIKLQRAGFSKIINLNICVPFHRIVELLFHIDESDLLVHLRRFQIDSFDKKADQSCCGHISLIHEPDLII